MGCRCSELHSYMFRLHLNENMMTSEIVSRMSMFQEPEEIFPLVFSLKEKGNNMVKLRKFEEAFSIYSKAVTFLVLGLPCCAEGCHPFKDLAIPLNLNIAMCALKLSKFQWAKCLCDCVLEFDPINVKALFRRASAALGLGQLRVAEKDLTVANKVEPQNGDVSRELKKVTLLLHESFGGVAKSSNCGNMDIDPKVDVSSNCLGERNLSFNPLNLPNKVSPSLVDNGGSESVCSNSNGVRSDNLDGSIANLSNVCVDPPRPITELEDASSVSGSSCPSFNTNLAEPKRFSNQARPGSILTISLPDYKKLAAGQVLSYYTPHSTGFMSIRVKSSSQKLNSSPEMEEDDRASAIIPERNDNVADNFLDIPRHRDNACDGEVSIHNPSHSTNQNSPKTPITPDHVPEAFYNQFKISNGGLRSPRLTRRHPFVSAFKFGMRTRRLKQSAKRSSTSRVQPTPGMKRKSMSNTFISSYPAWKKRMLSTSDAKARVMVEDGLSSWSCSSNHNLVHWVDTDLASSITTELSAPATNKTVSLQFLGDFSIS